MKTDSHLAQGLVRHEPRPEGELPGARSLSHSMDMLIAFAPCRPSCRGPLVVTHAKRRDVETPGPRVRYLLPGVRREES